LFYLKWSMGKFGNNRRSIGLNFAQRPYIHVRSALCEGELSA
jgi:hypothetical protein